MPDGIGKDQVVAIYAEGKEHALAIGTTLMTSDQMFVSSFFSFLWKSWRLTHCLPSTQTEGQPRTGAGQRALPQRRSLDLCEQEVTPTTPPNKASNQQSPQPAVMCAC